MKTVFAKTAGLTDRVTHYCPGCTHGIIHRLIGEILEEMEIIGKTVGVAPVGCAGFCENYFACDIIGAAHGRAVAVATGAKRAHPDRVVFTYQGDGDGASIGLAETVSAAARGEKLTSIFVNNAIYGMTGGQMAPTTLLGMKTATSPYGRDESMGYPLDLPKLLAQVRGAAYVASVSVDNPQAVREAKKALKKAFQVQLDGLGYSFVSILSTCPTNWGVTPVEALEWVRTKMKPYFALGELKVPAEEGGGEE
ncbi:Thiamin diphosphate-binding fold [Acididesulfobacillus acetoxydans]|uniref:Ketoisovalerate oxidoreductase subunit VorA n=1 Tax=Acididesulfobacillus acetoxydans TaxID=1561005 RepID=A0A8S0XAK0_9FIRM|nr:thiamine pyrophosphate-dependent enzyme [Acididesulfobacillus acetoxydans]CAA7599976.1 Thiamin diphosphate-binding fold [Acididesulfobacillus acetoxydans]CEJ07932.1 Ketoisovalerate oxidoreductase subunit VorA [Acididesulfobacillus acetoxydans]